MSLPPAVAANPGRSRGRLHHESNSGPRGPRDIFQRDRDRLIHSVAFRRLRHKTQVFVAPDGDHYRVRLTHSLEVAQIGRTMARALGLNEDLTEALCLAHDLGHPPFGHAGEDALSAALADVGGFDHNAHTIRIVTRLETPYPDFDGLNLSWEALEGLAKHNGPIPAPSWALAEANAAFDAGVRTVGPGQRVEISPRYSVSNPLAGAPPVLVEVIKADSLRPIRGFRDVQFGIEYKLKEPRNRLFWSTAAATCSPPAASTTSLASRRCSTSCRLSR